MMPHFKTLATPSRIAISPKAYFAQLDTNKHCFAICVLFVLNKIESHYTCIEDIQIQHKTLPQSYPLELPPLYLQGFQVNETCSEPLSIETFKTHHARFDQMDHVLIVLTSSTQRRHCIAFRQQAHRPYAELLNTSGQSGIPRVQYLQSPYSKTIGDYMDSLIENNHNMGNEIQTIRLITYTRPAPL